MNASAFHWEENPIFTSRITIQKLYNSELIQYILVSNWVPIHASKMCLLWFRENRVHMQEMQLDFLLPPSDLK